MVNLHHFDAAMFGVYGAPVDIRDKRAPFFRPLRIDEQPGLAAFDALWVAFDGILIAG